MRIQIFIIVKILNAFGVFFAVPDTRLHSNVPCLVSSRMVCSVGRLYCKQGAGKCFWLVWFPLFLFYFSFPGAFPLLLSNWPFLRL